MSLDVLSCHVPIRARGSVALARCFRIESTTAATTQTWRFTTAPCDHYVLEHSGTYQSYSPTQVVARGTTRRLAQMGERSSQLRIGVNASGLTATQVASRFLDGALVYEHLVDWRNWHLPPMQVLRWRVATWSPNLSTVLLELRGIASELQNEVGEPLTPACANVFADARCDAGGVIAGNSAFAFKDLEIAAGTHTRNRFIIRERAVPNVFPAAAVAVANWFAHGALKFTTGSNDDVQSIIETNTLPAVVGSVYESTFEVVKPLPFVPVEGDRVSIRVGCDRARTTCTSKFANSDQFRGFDYGPGSDWMKRTPEAS